MLKQHECSVQDTLYLNKGSFQLNTSSQLYTDGNRAGRMTEKITGPILQTMSGSLPISVLEDRYVRKRYSCISARNPTPIH